MVSDPVQEAKGVAESGRELISLSPMGKPTGKAKPGITIITGHADSVEGDGLKSEAAGADPGIVARAQQSQFPSLPRKVAPRRLSRPTTPPLPIFIQHVTRSSAPLHLNDLTSLAVSMGPQPTDPLQHRIVTKALTVYNPPSGTTHIGTSVSIKEYLLKKLQQGVFEGPLTDYESSDFEDGVGDSLLTTDGQSTPSSTSTPPNASSTPVNPSVRLPKQKQRSKRRRSVKRDAAQAEGSGIKHVSKKRRLEATKDTLALAFNVGTDVEVTKPGWLGKRIDSLPRKEFCIKELVDDYGMTCIPWDGKLTHLLLDEEKHVIGVLVGQPRDELAWGRVHDEALAALKAAAARMTFTEKETTHRRGYFPAVAHGISFGGGQEEPRHLSHTKAKNAALEELMETSSIQRICKFASSAFKLYGQKNYEYMETTMEKLRASRDGCKNERLKLRRPYDSKVGVFPCRSFNLGQQSISFPHIDEGNLAQSWCSITPLGSFNAKNGGHIVLWDLGLVVEFPAASTILIPSALLKHSNTSIRPGETRFSIIQYASGGLYRWVENGFMSEKDWLSKASEKELEDHRLEQDVRWARAAEMFTKLGVLVCPVGERKGGESATTNAPL